MARRLILFALALALSVMLSGCGHWLVEDAPVQVGNAVMDSVE